MSKHDEVNKRADMYKEPVKFLNNYMYESDMLADMQLEHWKAFDAMVKKDRNFKAGDFIDTAVRVACNQIVEVLNKLTEQPSAEDVDKRIYEIREEIYKEIAPNKENGT